tara:strand:- start:433 stop:717 length:285 start_codon:yes stop_codon:yes gene_type:complete
MNDLFSDTNRQLRKLSIYKPMQFRVTEIDFDFDSDSFDEEVMDTEDRQEVIDEVLVTTWEAADEEDLIEEITNATGWCIKSIDYHYLPKFHQSI